MKKLLLAPIASLLLFSCGGGSKVPADIKEFLMDACKTNIDTVKEGNFTEILDEKVNGESGKHTIHLHFERKDEDNFSFKFESHYEGKQIKEESGIEITSKVIELKYSKFDTYQYSTTVNDGKTNTIEIDRSAAYKHYYKIYDAGGNVYRSNGLFYGDLLDIKAKDFYPKYSLNEDKSQLTFKEENAEYEKGLMLDQNLLIDRHGMVLDQTQYARMVDTASSNYTSVKQFGDYYYG